MTETREAVSDRDRAEILVLESGHVWRSTGDMLACIDLVIAARREGMEDAARICDEWGASMVGKPDDTCTIEECNLALGSVAPELARAIRAKAGEQK